METLNKIPAIELYQALLEQLGVLVEQLRCHCTGVVVYQLPLVEADSVVPAHFPVERLGSTVTVNEEALELACKAFTRFFIAAGQKNTTTYRLPGYFSVSKDISELVQQINSLKEQLQKHLATIYPNTVNRSRACKQLFPGIHMNQVYRHVFLVPRNIRRINFTWQCQTPADVWISPADAIQLAETALDEESQKSHSGSEDPARVMALEIALQYFKGLPEPVELSRDDLASKTLREIPYQLLHRNYVRPHPRVQLFDPEEGSAPLFTHAANLPIIGVSSSESVDVRDLKDYAAGQSKKRSDTKAGFEEISSALHIFGGHPSVDMCLRRLALAEKAEMRKMKTHGAES